MQKTALEKIHEAVEKAKNLPRAVIEYNLELPQSPHITETEFYGCKARFNKEVDPSVGYNVIFTY